MASDVPPQSEFPQEMALVPAEEVVRETFGWTPASWAIALVGVPCVVFVQPAKPTPFEYATASGVILVGMLLLGYEFRRRVRPRALVRYGLGPRIGVYRHGKFDLTVPVENVTLFLRHPSKTWGAILFAGLGSVFCIAILLTLLTALDASGRLLVITACLFLPALLGSVIRTRLSCEEILFSGKGSRGMNRMLVPKTAIPKLLSR